VVVDTIAEDDDDNNDVMLEVDVSTPLVISIDVGDDVEMLEVGVATLLVAMIDDCCDDDDSTTLVDVVG
jgi:hypothetical protein